MRIATTLVQGGRGRESEVGGANRERPCLVGGAK